MTPLVRSPLQPPLTLYPLETMNNAVNDSLESNVILIVDDTPTNLEVLSNALTSAGLRVAVATDGESALEQVDYAPPDLILLDVLMPGMDGFEVCKQLKASPVAHGIPVIFMTALANPGDKLKGMSLGAVDYVTKPFQKEEVLARVKTHLQLRQLTQTLAEKNVQLKQFNEALEQQVAARTAELEQALNDLKHTQVQLIQQEKLSTLGQLVAGVAHEINNPTGFILSNLAPAREYVADITQVMRLYQQHYPQPVAEIEQAIEDAELNYVLQDLPAILDSMQLGADRIRDISASLRRFSRADAKTKVAANIHDGLNSALLILGYRLKARDGYPAIAIQKQYGDLPTVECYPGQLNQVFMNILSNAIDALETLRVPETAKNGAVPTIQISTAVVENSPTSALRCEPADAPPCNSADTPPCERIAIRITDNGPGMPAAIQQQIFDPLFTTKASHQGTGLGLSISHQIIAGNHGGQLTCQSTVGEGTEFAIILPITEHQP